MISKDKKYVTRDGREVRIYATDGGRIKCVHGAYLSEENFWVSTAWTADGRYDAYSACDHFDLIEVRPRIKRTVWLNVYENYVEVDATATDNRIGCIKVDLDFAEGDGL